MHAVELVLAVVGAAFWASWLVAALSTKRGASRGPASCIRVVIFALAILLIRFEAFRNHGLNTDLWRAGLGLVLFAGLGFAVWACLHIGPKSGHPDVTEGRPGAGDQRFVVTQLVAAWHGMEKASPA